MKKMIIAVIAGLDSPEAEVSLRSATEVYDALDRDLFEPYLVTIQGTQWRVGQADVDKNIFGFTDDNDRVVRFEYAVSMIHGVPGENGVIQGYFELMGIPYAGCGVEASAVTFNKTLCKKVVTGVQGVALAREIFLREGDAVDPQAIVAELGLPLFVKPNASGSSCGVTKVKRVEQLEEAIRIALNDGGAALLEEYVQGTEVSQGVMVIGEQDFVLPITELVSKNEFFDYEAKYTPGMTDEITPARIESQVSEKLNRATLEIYKRLDCRGVVRVDYIIKEGTPYFIEVNTTPGMSRNSIVPQQWRAMGYSMQQAYTMIINNKTL